MTKIQLCYLNGWFDFYVADINTSTVVDAKPSLYFMHWVTCRHLLKIGGTSEIHIAGGYHFS